MRINECITYIRHDQPKKFVLVDSVLPFKHYICIEDMKETAQIQKYYKRRVFNFFLFQPQKVEAYFYLFLFHIQKIEVDYD